MLCASHKAKCLGYVSEENQQMSLCSCGGVGGTGALLLVKGCGLLWCPGKQVGIWCLFGGKSALLSGISTQRMWAGQRRRCMCVHAQSCPTFCDPMDYSLPGSSAHGIFQARILEWVAFSSSGGNANILWIIEKARKFQKNIYFCFIDYAKAFDYVDHNKLWKILKEMGIPDHLTCLLRNLYVDQEAIVRTGHGPTDWFQVGKGVCQGCILSPWLFNWYAEYIMRNAGVDEAQAGIKIAERNINNLRYADDTTLMWRKWRRTKEPLDESERGE